MDQSENISGYSVAGFVIAVMTCFGSFYGVVVETTSGPAGMSLLNWVWSILFVTSTAYVLAALLFSLKGISVSRARGNRRGRLLGILGVAFVGVTVLSIVLQWLLLRST